mmetsp:Transcript_74192/g.241262  ORF Transcript_74192/g.241262 Transcript_74192/m.241262 type:complete len:222 (-) Transcript_74192:480-1145(-)
MSLSFPSDSSVLVRKNDFLDSVLQRDLRLKVECVPHPSVVEGFLHKCSQQQILRCHAGDASAEQFRGLPPKLHAKTDACLRNPGQQHEIPAESSGEHLGDLVRPRRDALGDEDRLTGHRRALQTLLGQQRSTAEVAGSQEVSRRGILQTDDAARSLQHWAQPLVRHTRDHVASTQRNRRKALGVGGQHGILAPAPGPVCRRGVGRQRRQRHLLCDVDRGPA